MNLKLNRVVIPSVTIKSKVQEGVVSPHPPAVLGWAIIFALPPDKSFEPIARQANLSSRTCAYRGGGARRVNSGIKPRAASP